MQPVVVATRNPGKLRELVPLFAAHGLEAITLDAAGIAVSPLEDGLEVFATFEENALAKARWFARLAGGRAVVADDSGLAVAALGGRPGVHSKRFAGRDDLAGVALDAANNSAVLAALHGVSDRRAAYVCVVAYVLGDWEVVVRGETTGCVLEAGRGEGGFGYDPLFLSDDLGVTFGEASREMKGEVSHRGRAFRGLLEALEGAGGGGSAG